MRAIGLVLAALAFTFTGLTAEAATRSSSQASVSRASAARPAAAVNRGQLSRSASVAPRSAAPRSGVLRSARAAQARPVAGQAQGRRGMAAAVSCSRSSSGARRCTTARASWQAGLAPAANVQTSDCPEGTMATNALGHTNITRCMPI